MVEILDETARFPEPERLAAAIDRLLADAGLADRDVTIVILDDAAMHERNLADRGVDGPTDVLSYPTHEPDDVGMPEIPHLGDVLIDLDLAAGRLRVRGKEWRIPSETPFGHAVRTAGGLVPWLRPRTPSEPRGPAVVAAGRPSGMAPGPRAVDLARVREGD